MIIVTFAIQNPYFESWKSFKHLRNWHGSTPFRNKYWEFELLKNGCIVEFDFTVRTRCDHAGVTLGLGLFGYSINMTLYDNRHWDHKTNTWSINELH
jgi:hypothetical protein